MDLRIDKIMKNRRTLSFEVFPPKPEADSDLSGIRRTMSELAAARPDFVSVTYGAGGNNRPRALDIARIVMSMGMNPLSHLTAVGYTKEDASRVLNSLDDLGVGNILALRGDIPNNAQGKNYWKDYSRASELARHISGFGVFCVGGAAYPEGHQQSISPGADIEYMREKVDAGVSFFITQLFFDNDVFLRFIDAVEASGVDTPIIAGIMPLLRANQIKRIVDISGCVMPERLSRLLDKYIDDDKSMEESGIDYAAEQIQSLWKNGVSGIHVYTMNRSREVMEILERCGLSGGGCVR
jgi:methylenetetrahydrofolate reductase (NADPH)